MDLIEKIKRHEGRVVVIGIGYVGLPLVVEFATAGFHVTGYDKDERTVRLLNKGQSYIEDIPTETLEPLVRSGKRASELLHLFDPVPQLLKNVRFSGGKPLEDARVKAVIADVEAQLNGKGRLVIRPSGTEPVIRVMAEGDDASEVEQVVDAICAAVKEAAA